MKKPIFCIPTETKALFFAKKRLLGWDYPVTAELTQSMTHLLLPVPTPREAIPQVLPGDLTVLGGNLPPLPWPAVDLLKDEDYLRQNAAITAACALELARQRLPLADAAALVLGWGRIGKCLAAQLRLAGARVTVAARKEADLATLQSLGYQTVYTPEATVQGFDVVFNTIPAPVLDGDGAFCIDLASEKGISGDQVLWARGLPGKMAPEHAGDLIARTALRLALRKE